MKNILILVILPPDLPLIFAKVFKRPVLVIVRNECKFQTTIYSRLFVLTGRFINVLFGKIFFFILGLFYTLVFTFMAT